MEMWIILSCLVGVVLLLLIFTTVHDRKKRKRLLAKKTAEAAAKEHARVRVVAQINHLIYDNAVRIKDFVPSIGELKMADIRSRAKSDLQKIKASPDYKKINEEKANVPLIESIKKLETISSNTWTRELELCNFFTREQAFKKVIVPKIELVAPKKRGLFGAKR